jgi:hypothetical protein
LVSFVPTWISTALFLAVPAALLASVVRAMAWYVNPQYLGAPVGYLLTGGVSLIAGWLAAGEGLLVQAVPGLIVMVIAAGRAEVKQRRTWQYWLAAQSGAGGPV